MFLFLSIPTSTSHKFNLLLHHHPTIEPRLDNLTRIFIHQYLKGLGFFHLKAGFFFFHQNLTTCCMDKYIAICFILRRKIWYSTIVALSTRFPRGGGRKRIASEWRRFLDMRTAKNNATFSTQVWRIQAKTQSWRISILIALLDDSHVSLWEKNNLVRVDDQCRKGGCCSFLKFWHVPLTRGGVMVVFSKIQPTVWSFDRVVAISAWSP